MSVKTIFQEGMKERKRRKSLGKVNRDYQEKEKALAAQLAALGRKAWEAQADISAFPELKAALAEAQKTLDDLRQQAEDLRRRKQGLEDERKRESERLGAAIKKSEEAKREVDSRLGEQRSALEKGRKETQRATGRLEAVSKERSQLQNKAADPAAGEAEKGEIAKGLEKLAREETELQAANRAREEAGRPLAAAVAALQEEAARAQKALEELRGELKKKSGDLDKGIAALAGELARNGEKTRESEAKQALSFQGLGEKLASAAVMEPSLAQEMAAVQNARSESAGVQALISRLEEQKDEGQVSAYKKMVAIVVGSILLLAAIAVALFLLLSPKKEPAPLLGLLPGQEKATQALEQLAGQVGRGLGTGAAEAEQEEPGEPAAIASEAAMKSVLPSLPGWQPTTPYYSQGTFNNMKISSLQADYAAPDGGSVHLQVTDACAASALLAPVKTVVALGIRVDDADVMQQMATVEGLPVVERVDKHDGEATIGIIYKDRYLIELKTRAARGLDLLRQFAAKLDLSGLPDK